MGSSESGCFNVSLIVKDKVTRQCPQSTTFEEKGVPKRIPAEVPLLTHGILLSHFTFLVDDVELNVLGCRVDIFRDKL